MKDSIKDVENLHRYFVKKHGKPKHTYMWGRSGGGMVTSTIIDGDGSSRSGFRRRAQSPGSGW